AVYRGDASEDRLFVRAGHTASPAAATRYGWSALAAPGAGPPEQNSPGREAMAPDPIRYLLAVVARAFLIASTAMFARHSTTFLPKSMVFSFGTMLMPLIVVLLAAMRCSSRTALGS